MERPATDPEEQSPQFQNTRASLGASWLLFFLTKRECETVNTIWATDGCSSEDIPLSSLRILHHSLKIKTNPYLPVGLYGKVISGAPHLFPLFSSPFSSFLDRTTGL